MRRSLSVWEIALFSAHQTVRCDRSNVSMFGFVLMCEIFLFFLGSVFLNSFNERREKTRKFDLEGGTGKVLQWIGCLFTYERTHTSFCVVFLSSESLSLLSSLCCRHDDRCCTYLANQTRDNQTPQLKVVIRISFA